jgi:transposase
MQDLKKNKIYASFAILKITNNKPELFLILKIINKIFLKIYN